MPGSAGCGTGNVVWNFYGQDIVEWGLHKLLITRAAQACQLRIRHLPAPAAQLPRPVDRVKIRVSPLIPSLDTLRTSAEIVAVAGKRVNHQSRHDGHDCRFEF